MNDSPHDRRPLGDAALAFAALSHPVRMKILQHLHRTDTCCCKEVVEQFDMAQSTVSQHLKVLVDAGLVRFSSERQRSCYCVDREALNGLVRAVNALFDQEAAPPEDVHGGR
ncbi:MAG: ArsR/SmtB family transcription factor [Rhizobiaceae bacterium]